MELLKRYLTLLALSFSLPFESDAQNNIANKLMCEFINQHYKYHGYSMSGVRFGYDLGSYDTLLVLQQLDVARTCAPGQKLIIDRDFLRQLTQQRIVRATFILSDSQDRRKPTVIISDFLCTTHGYFFTGNVYVNGGWFSTPLYFSRSKNRLLAVDKTAYVLP